MTETINIHCQDMKQTNNSFEVHHIDMFEDPMVNNTICNELHDYFHIAILQRNYTISEDI